MNGALNFAIVVPMANEEPDFWPFVNEIRAQLDLLKAGRVYCVVDDASVDLTVSYAWGFRAWIRGLSRFMSPAIAASPKPTFAGIAKRSITATT